MKETTFVVKIADNVKIEVARGAVSRVLEKGEKATDRVWEAPKGLEWTVPSPAPYHTFDTPPVKRVAQESFE